jgi:hypothetical protein
MSKEEGVPSTAPAIVPAEREAHIGSLAAGAMLKSSSEEEGEGKGEARGRQGFRRKAKGQRERGNSLHFFTSL